VGYTAAMRPHVLTLLALAACTPDEPVPAEPTGDPTPTDPPVHTDVPAPPAPKPQTTHAHRLTAFEYTRAVEGLVGEVVDLSDLLPVDAPVEGSDRHYSANYITRDHVDRWAAAAERVAARLASAPPVITLRLADLNLVDGTLVEDFWHPDATGWAFYTDQLWPSAELTVPFFAPSPGMYEVTVRMQLNGGLENLSENALLHLFAVDPEPRVVAPIPLTNQGYHDLTYEVEVVGSGERFLVMRFGQAHQNQSEIGR